VELADLGHLAREGGILISPDRPTVRSGSDSRVMGLGFESHGRLTMIAVRSLVFLALCVVVNSAVAQQETAAQASNVAGAVDAGEVVLFPFDDYSIPLTYGLSYNLIQGHREGVVLRPAASGPDAQHIINHGSVIKVGDEFRMWYLCLGDQDPEMFESDLPVDVDLNHPQLDRENRAAKGDVLFRVCYAVSRDGVNWKRPALGLVKYGADTRNNLVDFPIGDYRVINLVVIDDQAEPDPARRFKMAFQSIKYQSRIAVAFSPDGLHWKESPLNPVTRHMTEIHGLVRWKGAYYVNGHGGSPRPGPNAIMPRRMVTYMSYDFEHWADATALSFERHGGVIPNPTRGHAGEQIHTGASLWNRGNVIIGFYGQWHGDPSDDRRLVTMDLGMVTSNDALHYKEPVPDFRIIAGNEEGETVTHTLFSRLASGGSGSSLFGLALTQGQGWANVGDQTLYWYSVWSQGRIRLATWLRDRFGYFEVPMEIRRRQEVPAPRRGLKQGEQGALATPKRPEPKSPWEKVSPHFISFPITLQGPDQKVFVNADGLSEDGFIKVEILDQQFRVLPGYSSKDCAPITESGFRQPAIWGAKTTLDQSDRPIRVRVNLEGQRPEDVRVYAAYVAKN
jgi:hypothetical protein